MICLSSMSGKSSSTSTTGLSIALTISIIVLKIFIIALTISIIPLTISTIALFATTIPKGPSGWIRIPLSNRNPQSVSWNGMYVFQVPRLFFSFSNLVNRSLRFCLVIPSRLFQQKMLSLFCWGAFLVFGSCASSMLKFSTCSRVFLPMIRDSRTSACFAVLDGPGQKSELGFAIVKSSVEFCFSTSASQKPSFVSKTPFTSHHWCYYWW